MTVCSTCNDQGTIERLATPAQVDNGYELGIAFDDCPCACHQTISPGRPRRAPPRHRTPRPGRGVIVNLFAGPGGWCEALRILGIGSSVGIEWDAAACATRRAAGHRTIRADVSAYPTAPFIGRCSGVIASPPCPTFSTAGKGEGRDELPHLIAAADRIAQHGWTDPNQLHDWSDARTPLVLEPLRWVAALNPEWVALEQVPDVMPLWQRYARIWHDAGYSTWAGILNAADFGVPQTRRRAFCLAHRTRTAAPPHRTHTKGGASTLMGELAPWVSMADALGWGMTSRPMPTVTGGGTSAGGAEPIARGGRDAIERERERARVIGYRRTRGAGMNERHGNRPDTPVDEPAPTLTSKARCDVWVVDRRTNSRGAGGGTVPTVPVPMSEPAPTLTGIAGGQWVFRNGAQANATVRPVTEPAPTMASADNGDSRWVYEQPATTVAGDPRITARCHHEAGTQGRDARTTQQVQDGEYDGTEPIKLTVEEASILQSFRPDYPWAGTKTKQFEQVGNAVPPRLAAHVLAALLGLDLPALDAA